MIHGMFPVGNGSITLYNFMIFGKNKTIPLLKIKQKRQKLKSYITLTTFLSRKDYTI